jgi:hypothetical protein
MGLLRDAGFSCPDISHLSGGRWSSDNVRQYGAWSGAADFSRRDAALGVFSEFVSKGYKFEDVAGYLETKKELDASGMTYKDLITIGKAILVSQASLIEFYEFSQELLEAKKTMKELRARMDLDVKLDGLGITLDVQKKVLELSMFYGGVDGFSAVLIAHESLLGAQAVEEKIEKNISINKQEIKELEDFKKSLTDDITPLSKIVAGYNLELIEINLLYSYGWNIGSLMLVGNITKKLGGVNKFLEVMNKYSTSEDFEAEVEKRKAEIGSSETGEVAKKPVSKVKTMEEIIDEISGDEGNSDESKK